MHRIKVVGFYQYRWTLSQFTTGLPNMTSGGNMLILSINAEICSRNLDMLTSTMCIVNVTGWQIFWLKTL